MRRAGSGLQWSCRSSSLVLSRFSTLHDICEGIARAAGLPTGVEAFVIRCELPAFEGFGVPMRAIMPPLTRVHEVILPLDNLEKGRLVFL